MIQVRQDSTCSEIGKATNGQRGSILLRVLELIIDWIASLWGLTDPERRGKKAGKVWIVVSIALMVTVVVLSVL